MKWLPMDSEHFEVDAPVMSRQAAWVVITVLVLAVLVIAALVMAELTGGAMALPAD